MADTEGQSKEETKGASPKPDQDVAPPLITKRKLHHCAIHIHEGEMMKYPMHLFHGRISWSATLRQDYHGFAILLFSFTQQTGLFIE